MKLYIKYMVSFRCKLYVQKELKKLGLHWGIMDLGKVEVIEDISEIQREKLKRSLSAAGLELIEDKKRELIENIKTVIIELIHYNDELPHVNYSNYISEKLGYDYAYLAHIFSEVKGVTIQQFIILNKIERVKEILLYEDISLTEIAYKLDYSSVSHLSNQFKKITGLSPSYYKKLKERRQLHLENV